MSDNYSKVTCPNCGVNIEYPADYQLASIPCPRCSEIVPLYGERKEALPPRPPETPTTLPATPPAVGGSGNRNVMLAAVFAIVGLILLAVGYSAPARARAALPSEQARTSGAVWDAERKALDEYKEAIKRMAEGNYETPQEQSERAMKKTTKDLLKGQKDLFDSLKDFLDESSAKTRGAIQYCTGWLLIAAAGIVYALGRRP